MASMLPLPPFPHVQEEAMHDVSVTTALMLAATNSEFSVIIGAAEDALAEAVDDGSLEDLLAIVLGCEV
jgi:hypothetical protein